MKELGKQWHAQRKQVHPEEAGWERLAHRRPTHLLSVCVAI